VWVEVTSGVEPGARIKQQEMTAVAPK